MKWFLYAIREILVTILAYIVNPIVCLFADNEGWLPRWLFWFQTYDNTLDVEWMITENVVPKFAQYDYAKHYVYHYEEKFEDGTVIPGYVSVLDPRFTIKERVQRYICRLAWLYRNTNYGFSYLVNGVDIDASKLLIVRKWEKFNDEQCICYDPTVNLWDRPWCIYYCKQYCKKFRLRIYLGWKLKSLHSGRHMLALHISPFKPVEKIV